MKKHLFSLITLLLAVTSCVSAQTSGYPELDAMVQITKKQHMDNTYNSIDLAGWTKVGEGGNGSVYT